MRFLFRPRCGSDVASSWMQHRVHCGAAVFAGNGVGFNRAQDKEISEGRGTLLPRQTGCSELALSRNTPMSSGPFGCGWKHAATGWAERNVLHAKLSYTPWLSRCSR